MIPPAEVARLTGTPQIWVHAVSVGKMTVAAPVGHIYYPLDLPWVVRKVAGPRQS